VTAEVPPAAGPASPPAVEVSPPALDGPPAHLGVAWYRSVPFLTWAGTQGLSVGAFLAAVLGHPFTHSGAAQGAVATGAVVVAGLTSGTFIHGLHRVAEAALLRDAAYAHADRAIAQALTIPDGTVLTHFDYPSAPYPTL
jgi:hypothetical protein